MVPLDGKNLNRSFPGDARGSAAERIAAAVTEELIKGSDYVIDLHAGDLPEALEPFVFYDASPVERQARELALAYGLGHMVRQSSDGRTVAGSTSAAAADLGIPSFTAESGECGILARDAVDRHLRGLQERPAPAATAPRRRRRVRPPGRARRLDLDENDRRRMVAARGCDRHPGCGG